MNKYKELATGLESPAVRAVSISGNDSADLAEVTRAVYIGAGGDITCILDGDTTPVTFSSMVTGVIYQLRIKRLYATGTNANNIIGLY